MKLQSNSFKDADVLSAEFAFADTETVRAIFALVNAIAVVAIAILVGVKDHVAILVLARMVCVRTVFVEFVTRKQTRARDRETEFLPLFEERTREIKLPTILKRIPFVAMPVFLTVNFVRGSRPDIRDDCCAGQVARTLVECELVHACHASLQPAIGAHRRLGKHLLDSSDNRRKYVEKRSVFVGDCERC